MVLTAKQKDELNRAILGYLQEQGYSEALEALKREAAVQEAIDEKFHQLLEKKWTAIVRLQKKIMQLEATVAALQEVCARAPRVVGLRGSGARFPHCEPLVLRRTGVRARR